MKIGSLFSGIGGLELGVAVALARLGVEHSIAWQVECDAFCRRVLAKHWPDTDRSVEDVRHAGRTTLAPVDLMVGGFPCQDVSPAGKGAGLAVGTRSGLWYEYRRVVSELQPPAVIVENVAGGASRWLCEVRTDLHDLGYRTRALGIAAADVGAPHLRRRIFVLALGNTDRTRRKGGWVDDASRPGARGDVADHDLVGSGARAERAACNARGRTEPVACGSLADGDGDGRERERSGGLFHVERASLGHDTDGCGRAHVPDPERIERRDEQGRPSGSRRSDSPEPRDDASGLGAGAQPCVGGMPHGLPARLDGRWPAGRGEEQHAWEAPRSVPTNGDRARRPRLKGLGNAVVPACAERACAELLAWSGAA